MWYVLNKFTTETQANTYLCFWSLFISNFFQCFFLTAHFHFENIEKPLVFSLREMCPNTEFFLVRVFSHSDWIRKDTKYLSVFSPNAGKYGPEKTPYLDIFHAVSVSRWGCQKGRNGLRKLCKRLAENLLKQYVQISAISKPCFIMSMQVH